MSAYSGYRGGGSMLTAYIYIFVSVVVAGLVLSMLFAKTEIPTVDVAPKPTFDPHEDTGGIDTDKAAEEARSLIPDLVPGGEARELSSSTGGHLRVVKSGGGRVVIAGHNNAEGLLAAAKEIAAQLGVDVGPW